jgi:hypothetical protein
MSDLDKPAPPDNAQGAASQRDSYLKELHESLADPLHKRLIAAYQKGDDPVISMEAELGSALTEILTHED